MKKYPTLNAENIFFPVMDFPKITSSPDGFRKLLESKDERVVAFWKPIIEDPERVVFFNVGYHVLFNKVPGFYNLMTNLEQIEFQTELESAIIQAADYDCLTSSGLIVALLKMGLNVVAFDYEKCGWTPNSIFENFQ